jgi:hypothetical protein
MAIQIDPRERNPQKIVDAIRQLVEGRNNAVGQFTLTPGATTTTVSHPNCSVDCRPLFSAVTANAAAAMATTFISAISQGQFVVTHASNAQADRTFNYSVGGG